MALKKREQRHDMPVGKDACKRPQRRPVESEIVDGRIEHRVLLRDQSDMTARCENASSNSAGEERAE